MGYFISSNLVCFLMRYKPNNFRKKQRVKDMYMATRNVEEKRYIRKINSTKHNNIKLLCGICERSVSINKEEFHEKIACPSCMNRGKISFYIRRMKED